MKNILFLLLLVVVSCAQTGNERFQGENGKYGYKNKQGEVIVAPKYDAEPYYDFRDGYARVNLNDKYGFVNEQGQEVIPLRYDYVELFYNDLSVVVLDDKKGVVDRQNQVVIPIAYDDIDNYWKGRLKVKFADKWGIINYNNQIIVPILCDYIGDLSQDLITVAIDKKIGAVDQRGKIVVPIIYDDISIFVDTLAVAELGGHVGYINKKGEVVIPIEYEYGINDICVAEGLFPVKRNGKFGFVNRDNQLIIPFVYDETFGFSEGVAAVKQNECWGFINHQNEVVIPFEYSFAYKFEEGKAGVSAGNKYGYVDKKGNFHRDYQNIVFFSTLFGVPLLLIVLVLYFVIKRNLRMRKGGVKSANDVRVASKTDPVAFNFNVAQIVNLSSLSIWVFATFSIPAGYEMGALLYVILFVFFGVVQLIITIVLIQVKARPIFFYVLAGLGILIGAFFIVGF